MKISTKGRYGLRILLDLALHDSGEPRLSRDIAGSQQISEKYLSRLIIALREAGLVRAIRGARGGFRLRKQPAEISLLEVVEAMEGPLSIVDCVRCPAQCGRAEACATRSAWAEINTAIRDRMSRVTLQEIVDGHRRDGAAAEVPDYCI